MHYIASNNNLTWVSLSDFLFLSFKKNVLSEIYVDLGRIIWAVLYITPSYSTSVQEWTMQGMQQNYQNPVLNISIFRNLQYHSC